MSDEYVCGAVVTVEGHTWHCALRAGHATYHRAKVTRETAVELGVIERGTEITWSDGRP